MIGISFIRSTLNLKTSEKVDEIFWVSALIGICEC
jgi:hypothetical protein